MSLESSQTEQTWKAQDLIYAFLETEWRNGESERVSEEQKDEDATTEVIVLCLVWNLWGWFMKHVSSSWVLRLVKTRAMTQPHFLNTKSGRIEQLHEETFQWHQMVSFPSSSSSPSSMRAPVLSHLPLFLQCLTAPGSKYVLEKCLIGRVLVWWTWPWSGSCMWMPLPLFCWSTLQKGEPRHRIWKEPYNQQTF